MTAVVDERAQSEGSGTQGVRPVEVPQWAPPAAAVREWIALQLGLELLEVPPACADDPERWWSNRPGDVDDAKAVCGWCPLLAVCRAYALAADEPGGTWGGLSDTERRQVTGRAR